MWFLQDYCYTSALREAQSLALRTFWLGSIPFTLRTEACVNGSRQVRCTGDGKQRARCSKGYSPVPLVYMLKSLQKHDSVSLVLLKLSIGVAIWTLLH